MRILMIGAGVAALAGAAVVGYVAMGRADKPAVTPTANVAAPAPKTASVQPAPADPVGKIAAAGPAPQPAPAPAAKPAPLPAATPAPAAAPAAPTRTASLPPPKVGKMTGDQVKQHFFNGEQFWSSTPQGVKYRMMFSSDGKMSREPLGKAGAKASGQWQVQKDGFCTQWGNASPNCYGLIYGNDGRYNIMKGTTVVGYWSKSAPN
jgi:hypothetical protein